MRLFMLCVSSHFSLAICVYMCILITCFQRRSKTTDDHKGLYQADIIQQMVNRIYFKNRKDDGIALKNKYSPFPVVAFALILAAVCRLAINLLV